MPHGRLPWPVPAAACSTECSLSSRGHPVEGPGFLHEKGAFPPLTGPPVENVKVEVPPGSVPCPHRSARVCRGYSHFADHLLRYRRVRPKARQIFPFLGGAFPPLAGAPTYRRGPSPAKAAEAGRRLSQRPVRGAAVPDGIFCKNSQLSLKDEAHLLPFNRRKRQGMALLTNPLQ